MIKKINENFDKQLKEASNEKVNLTLESLAELNEEEHDEQVIKDTLYIGPRKYSIEVYPDVENGYIAHWEDDSDNGFGYNNKGWVNLSKNSQMLAFKEKGYADIEDYISVISVYDRSLRPEVKQEIIKKVLEVRGEGQPEDLEESVSRELVDEFADQYGLSKEEAKRRLSHLSKEEREEKLKALKGVRSNNAKMEVETEALTEELDENTKKEVEVELEDILKRNPEKHGFDADTEEVKYYVVKLLKDKGYKTETSGNDNYKPNKYHVEYWKEEKIEEAVENKKWYVYMDSPYASAERIGSSDTKEEAEAIKAKKDAEWKPGYLWNTYISDKEIKETNLGWD